MVASVEGAVRLGADVASVHINIGWSDDVMLEALGEVADTCDEF